VNEPPPSHQPYSQQPEWGAPQPPPKQSNTGKIVGFSCLGVVGFIVIIGAIGAAFGGGSDTADTSSKPAPAVSRSTSAPAEKSPGEKPAQEKPSEEKPPAEEPEEQSQADQFKAFVEKNGTPAEKKAVKHVTRVQGADKQNNLLDMAEIHTDYTGGLLGPHGGEGKLLASVFAEWKSSENGLVTVYDSAGEILANGNF
jgi:hypothetical protein